ncbi:MAG: uroporphyrinogen-III synthase [Ignavibacteriales bacterium]
MAGKEKTESNKNHKRERIIEAASALFSEKSFHEVMMEDVARLASIAKGTLYNYFASKEDLYFSIMLIRMTNLINSLKEKIGKENTPVESLHLFVIHNYMFMLKYSCFFLMFQKDNMNAPNTYCSEFRLKKTELNNILKGIVTKGIEENIFHTDDPDFAAQITLGSIYAGVSRAISSKYSKNEIDSEREHLFGFILKGLSRGPEAEKKLPLKDKTIVITRGEEASQESAALFTESGAETILFPTLQVTPPNSWDEFDSLVKKLDKTDILIFTSVNTVRMFTKRCSQLGLEPDYSNLMIAAVGKKTATACGKNNIPVNFIPREFSGAGIASELTQEEIAGKVVFIPGSAIAGTGLPEALRSKGASVFTAPVYDISVPSEEASRTNVEKLGKVKPDLFIFTSPSSFRNFLEIMKITEPKAYFNGLMIAAIGPTTASEIEKGGLVVDIIPEEHSMEGLFKAILNFYSFSKTA